jgi:transcriptional activator SPT7
MDLGSMTKKLKSLSYKSKGEFVTDLNLIWDNCLKYNQDMNHPLRRMANGMRKEAEKLIPLIPDLVIRTRAEVEAEERRKQNGGDDDGGEDSEDEPIMSSRGRKAGAKGSNKSRKAHGKGKEGTPGVDKKPHLQINGVLAKGREGSEAVDSNGFATPPVAGFKTPSGMNGHSGIGSTADVMDIDGPSLNGMALNQALGEAAEQAYEDEEYKIWKQVTKKDRARVAKERFQLFKDNRLNVEAPAVLRTRAAMRRFLKAQKQYESGDGIDLTAQQDAAATASKPQETLAEEMEEDETERVIPDYYEPQGIIPSILPKLQWVEDNEGQVINQHEDSLQVVSRDYFKSPVSRVTKNIESNIRQIQETRKLATKIAVVKQMQIQAQVGHRSPSFSEPAAAGLPTNTQ